jgi:hypothetical protein
MSDEGPHCSGCGVPLMPGLETCRRCTRAWSGWYGLGAMVLGAPLGVIGGMFAFATSKGSGIAVVAVWMIGALGLVAFVAGAIDLARALFAKAQGKPDPRPLAVGWVLRSMDKG